MAKFIEYTGDGRIGEGRHGRLSTGQVIEVTDAEYRQAVVSDNFRAVEGADDEGSKADYPQPGYSQFFDLRHLAFEKPRVEQRLTAKTVRDLTNIAMAVEDITGQSVPYGPHASKMETVDSIMTLAEQFRWCEPLAAE